MTADPAPATGGPRQRIIAAAAELTATAGWSAVTMSRLAEVVGVSRQTVYNEVGSKPALAEAMVLTELAGFLAVVDRAFDQHPDDLAEAVREAARSVLVLARENGLLREIVSADHGAGTDLLPLLTTHADSVLSAAESAIARRVAEHAPPLPPAQLATVVDVVVRVVLSHVMQPAGDPDATAEQLAWLVGRVVQA